MSRVNATGRTDTKRKMRRMKIEGQFIAHKVDMIASPGFGALSKSERRLLDRLELEHAEHGGMENGNLICTYSDFNEFGIRLQGIAAAIRVVSALGFVEVMKQGRAGNGEHRTPSRYRLTYLNTTGANGADAEKPTDDWRKTETEEQARMIASAARAARSKNKLPPPKTVVVPPPKTVVKSPVTAPRNGSTGTTTETVALSISREGVAARQERETSAARLHAILTDQERLAVFAAYRTLAIWSALVAEGCANQLETRPGKIWRIPRLAGDS